MTRADFLLIGICLLAVAVLAVWFVLGGREGRTLRISCDGRLLETVAADGRGLEANGAGYYLFLFEESGTTWKRFETYPEVPEGVSYNLLSVSESGVSVEAADCRDQICVRHRPISSGGESIICLPHRFVVEIVSRTDEETPDGMVK